MRKSFRYGILALAVAFACLLSGCGAEQKHQIGVDGYVYVAETIERNADGSSRKFTVSGDYLYYLNNGNAVKRVPLEEFLGGGGLSGGEIVFSVSRALDSAEEMEDRDAFRMADIKDYAVDEEGSIYCILAVENRNVFGYAGDAAADTRESQSKSARGILYKQSSDGEMVYHIKLPELRIILDIDWLALDDKGRAYVLTAEEILAVDADGAVRGSLPVELAANLWDMQGALGRLLEGEGGAVYYVKDELGSSVTETYLLNEGETLRMTPVSFLSELSGRDLYEGLDGLLRVTSGSLYRCDVAKNSMEEILKWEDSSLFAEEVMAVVEIADGHYLVTNMSWSEMCEKTQLLTRTPVEELPERENIVIASLYPSADLRRCVVEFNRANEKYHVSLETYSGDREGKYVRLDADLVSRDAPDILDFSGLDVSKYADREMMEDLSPYLDRDGGINREDYLGNLLEGYTIKNQLVCIPKKFSAWVFWWVPRDTDGQGGWGMEEFMALAEKYPDRRVFKRGSQPVWHGASAEGVLRPLLSGAVCGLGGGSVSSGWQQDCGGGSPHHPEQGGTGAAGEVKKCGGCFFRLSPLWSQPVGAAEKEHGIFDGQTEQQHGETVYADPETAVRGTAVLKEIQIKFHIFRQTLFLRLSL